jgi:hypothetical protein
MPKPEHVHGEGCGCDIRSLRVKPSAMSQQGTFRGFVGQVLPALACAVCPACLATYAKALSVAGVSAWLSESQHLGFLTVAVAFSLVFGVRRARKLGRWEPFGFTVLGCALLVLAHLYDDAPWPTWAGLVALFVGGVYGQRLTIRAQTARPVVKVSDGARKTTVWAKRTSGSGAAVRELGRVTRRRPLDETGSP